MIAKITKNLQFRLEQDPHSHYGCYISCNGKKNEPFIMSQDYYGRKNSSCNGRCLSDVVINGSYWQILDFDNQDCIRNNPGGGQSSTYNSADTSYCMVVEVAGARFVKEEKVPPITVTISYYNSSAPYSFPADFQDRPTDLPADFQEKLTLNSDNCPTDSEYTWQ
ncbi:hypothetical protein AGMMS49950_09150 [Endomicrobiia bacterium]|nr:hypothetical protein AGMMS49531_06780 [Endomicrobiia bacterium]GHT71823.1 hypothetical protein AGMMS49950_09150 [Endomicrobiia bacterium]